MAAIAATTNGMSVTCMNGDLVYMTATVSVDKVQMDLSETDDWTLDSGNNVYTKSWAAADFESSEISVDGSDNLVLTKSISAPCKDEEVDGIPVCIATGHSLEFQCKYPLGTRTVQNDFSVSGHDANVDAEGVGELKYTLTVADANVQIGEPVEVTITPANPNLVFAQLKDCNVEYNSASVSILDYNNKFTVLEDVDCFGDDIGSKNNIMSLEACLDECDKFSGCDTVTWAPVTPRGNENKCHLKNNLCAGEVHISENPSRYNGFPGITSSKKFKAGAVRDQLSPVCEIGANVDTASGKTDLTFDWKAFKWATATKDAVEQQTISCTIELSKDSPDFDVGSC